jgi:hypothetical protein
MISNSENQLLSPEVSSRKKSRKAESIKITHNLEFPFLFAPHLLQPFKLLRRLASIQGLALKDLETILEQ